MVKKKCRHLYEAFQILYPINHKFANLVIQKRLLLSNLVEKKKKTLIALKGWIVKEKTMIKDKHKHPFFKKNKNNLVTFHKTYDIYLWRL